MEEIMKNFFENATLTVNLEGKVDTTNAAGVEKEIFTLINEHHPEKVILDVEKLTYISSVGLRIILKMKKTVHDTSVINASPDVYEIFSVTGFTDMLDVKKAYRQIDIAGCEMIGRGGHGTVYRLDGDTIVKVYKETEPFDEIEREVAYAKKAFTYGIPTAISFDLVKCGSCYGIVFELINADTFAKEINAEPEKFDESCAKYSALFKSLHDTKADTGIFESTKDLYNKWIDDLTETYTSDEIATLHQVVNSIPDCTGLVHGDIHPNNVMVQDGELVFIDMADLTYGHRIFDYAGMVLTHVTAKLYAKKLFGVDGDTMEKLFDNVMKADFPDKTDEELEKIKKVILGYGGIKYAIVSAVDKNLDPEIAAQVIKRAKEEIIPAAKYLIGAIDF